MFVGFLVSAVGYLINFFAGSNMVLLMIGAVLNGAGTIPASMLISLVGYTGSAENMPGGAITMIRLLYSLIPMVLYALTAFSLRLYKLDKLMPQIKADNEARRAAAEQAKAEAQE